LKIYVVERWVESIGWLPFSVEYFNNLSAAIRCLESYPAYKMRWRRKLLRVACYKRGGEE
jgi:hypothetical protein